ncbi:type I-MYXAN CRISPR-associated protein Cas6/Cmx6 [soil metagenome]
MIDVLFPLHGEAVPADHLYPLYAALSGLVPAFHDEATPLRFAPLTGVPGGPGMLALNEYSHLRVRLPDDRIRLVLPLAGKALDVGGHRIRLGVPSVSPLEPAATLQARVVTFKTDARHEITAEAFIVTARQKLADFGLAGEVSIPLALAGDRAGEPKRKIVRIHGQAIVGYSLLVTQLSAEHSIQMQEQGLGGRTKMGCGFFLPVRKEEQ